ncbi:thiazole-phosphate synthase [Streptomyces sp. 2333.5]|uniref:HisA/HisF-related TIM barrel protein n=1 Tax=Streptomyces TaxID=1883 RepID=UPI00089D0C50|nr:MULTISPECIES: HisA/HisF-related TIM barrel protein [unclassified Streptomyces]PJJ00612.1 thiazole-phosphate synthase [Streptomyces sp. 2333.5]SEC03719.1 thiazole-phosphate synthase [Streptomyces sp. 2314.4]SEC93058.1 thiazole-phosphate synthase [Streptomyces sp. 2112.2]SOE15249.1 thiazole-phosphate synthase [Streptomyces sp. 2323.1]
MSTAAVSAAVTTDPWLSLRGREFRSRLILGIEQYTDPTLVSEVLRSAACDVFITTFDLEQTKPSLLMSDLDDAVGLDDYVWIGTTSFARSQQDALLTARRLRDSYGIDIMKLDVRPSDNLPHNAQTVTAAAELIAEGFDVLPFILPDPATAVALEQAGCAAVRVMCSPVASARGVVDERAVRETMAAVSIPVVLEGGLGTPAQVVRAMELGADAVLVNTAVAQAPSPTKLAESMRLAVEAGRLAADQDLVGPLDK